MTLSEFSGKISAPATVDLLTLLPQGNIKDYYTGLLAGAPMTLRLAQVQTEKDPGGNLTSLTLAGTTSAFGLDDLNFEMRFEELYGALKSNLLLRLLQNKLSFLNFTRFTLGNVEINYEIADAMLPAKGRISGVVDLLTELRLALEYPVFQDEWLLQGSFVNPKGLIDLVDLAGGAALVSNLPPFIKNALDFKVQDVNLWFNAQEGKVKSLGLRAFNNAINIEVLPKIFLNNITLEAAVAFASVQSGPPPVAYSVSGHFQIGDTSKFPPNGSIVVTASGPDYRFSGGLSEGTRFSVSDFVHYFLGTRDDLPEVDINVFSFSAHLSSGAYSLHAAMEDDWKFYIDRAANKYLALSEASFIIEKAGGDYTGTASATFNVSGIGFTIVAAYGGANLGWSFSGSTGQGQAIAIGALMQELAQTFGAINLPPSLAQLTVENLGVSFNTKSKDFTFTCEAKFPVDDKEADLLLFLDLKNNNSVYAKKFSGHLQIGALQFDVRFSQDPAATIFLAAYSHPANQPQKIKVKELVANLSTAIADDIPSSLEIDLKDVLFAFDKAANTTKFIFGLDIGASVNLSNLPLVGKEFPPDQTVGVEDLQVLFATQNFSEKEVTDFNLLLPQDVTPLPIVPPQATGNTPAPNDPQRIVLTAGLNIAAKLKLGTTPMPLSLPMSAAPPANLGANSSPTTAAPPDNAKWFNIQKAFGPVHFERVGVQYQSEKLWFLLDAALSAAGLTLSLDGLAVGSALKNFSPEFTLRGLGLDFKSGPLEIGGAFLRQTVTTATPPYEQYSGAALIKTEVLTLSAIGSYAKLNNYYSLFLYAVLDYPLGGPAFFFVTGLSAGFGYNRGLQIPKLENVAQFPLVSEAVNGTSGPKNLEAELRGLQTYIPPAPGANFLAVGLKFTSFKMIDSFALLTVLFGDHFEIDVLGLSTLIVPTPEAAQVITPLAEVQMAVKASFIPAQGFLGISAQLTSASYLLSRACHLTGGFAFYSWFAGEHAGDFALTLGGYHPLYKVPAHYPQVPRVGFNWKIDDNLSLKGEAYYALTASALMAGGLLQALWQSDNIQAAFNANANFIIAWKPYFYDANVSVDIAVAVTIHFLGTHHITADVGADLHLWGPDFAGEARIHLWIVSFTINFGASSAQLKAIDWPTFQNSFLPKEESVCGITVQSGLVRKVGEDKTDLGVLNAKTLSLVTSSAIPAKEAYRASNKIGGQYAAFGVAPMNVKANDVTTAKHTITIKRGADSVEDKFDFEPVKKNMPVGMWGENLKPDINGPQLVTDALAGFKITPKNQPAAGVTHPIARKVLEAELEPVDNVYGWENFPAFNARVFDADEVTDERKRREALRASLANAATVRAQLLTALGVSSSVNISQAAAEVFVIAPQIEK